MRDFRQTGGGVREEGRERESRQEAIRRLAFQVMQAARMDLLLHHPFLNQALSCLQPWESDRWLIACDGERIYLDPEAFLIRTREEEGFPYRVWLHEMVHCLFAHDQVGQGLLEELWDLSCDLFAERLIAPLYPSDVLTPQQRFRAQEAERILQGAAMPTSEGIYQWLLQDPPDERSRRQWKELFSLDDHGIWREGASEAFEGGSSDSLQRKKGEKAGPKEAQEKGGEPQSPEGSTCLWKRMAGEMQSALLAASREQGEDTADLFQALEVFRRKRIGLKDFLSLFASRREVLKVSDEEFDYIFYTYGLSLYQDMPLVEPLEYQEDKKIRELVVVLDTSGSVSGRCVQEFLRGTWQVISSREAFALRYRLVLIQCDATVKRVDILTDEQDFERYLSTVSLRGFGGTDFRPAFEQVELMRREHQLQQVKGLLYFTDGLGIFPERRPPYPTAFVFVDRMSLSLARVPAWAITALMDGNSLSVYV